MRAGRLGRTTLALVAVASLGGCGGNDETDTVGQLVPVAGGGEVSPTDLVDVDPTERPTSTEVDLSTMDAFTVAPDGDIWFVDIDRGLVVEVRDDRVEAVAEVGELGWRAIAVGADDAVYLVSPEWELLRYQDGQVSPTGHAGESELYEPTAAPDGTVYLADQRNDQIVALAPDGSTRALVRGLRAWQMALAEDGTLYYMENPDLEWTVSAVTPSGEVREVVEPGTDDPVGVVLHDDRSPPDPGLAVNDDGVYVVHEDEIWRVDEEGRGERVLSTRRNTLAELAAVGHELYVWDDATSTVYRVEPDE